MGLSNDLPISVPAEDLFGLDPFTTSLARSIEMMDAPTGVVVAVNGAWGSGKSSAINLIKHHLKQSVDQGDLVLVPFNPWWFSGPDALTFAFFQELNQAIGPSLPKMLRKSIAKMGRGVSSTGALAGALANLKMPGIGPVISGFFGFFGELFSKERTVEEEHRLVYEALEKQKKRFLVIIDDIDRLNPDDALTIFRLVKSLGRLPNVIYLLAFDRHIAERIVTERFPSEGASYLEKIIQGTFELPPLQPDVLKQECIKAVLLIMGEPEESKQLRFWNVFYDIVSYMVKTPRDVVKLSNQLLTTWPSVAGNVDQADFLAITAIQLAEPGIYAAICQHPHELCGAPLNDSSSGRNLADKYDAMLLLNKQTEQDRQRLRVGLRRIFPRLDSIWSNTYHTGESWRRDRLIASVENFRSYFAFSISEDVVPRTLIDELLLRADDSDFVKDALRKSLGVIRRTGGTQAALLLDELNAFAPIIDVEKVASLTCTLFSLADDLNVESDASKGFGNYGDNNLRLHWLFNRMIHERFSIQQREALYHDAMEAGALEWSSNFAARCINYYQKAESSSEGREQIVSQEMAEKFVSIALDKIRVAAADGTLIWHQHLCILLFSWDRLARDGGASEVRAWTDKVLEHPDFVVALARQMPSTSFSMSMGFDEMGDRVQQSKIRVNIAAYKDILDVSRFEARIDEELRAGNLSEPALTTLRTLREIHQDVHG
ncbi:MAG: KAP family P-loop NTPase fold protein [Burkholderiales bacterium]